MFGTTTPKIVMSLDVGITLMSQHAKQALVASGLTLALALSRAAGVILTKILALLTTALGVAVDGAKTEAAGITKRSLRATTTQHANGIMTAIIARRLAAEASQLMLRAHFTHQTLTAFGTASAATSRAAGITTTKAAAKETPHAFGTVVANALQKNAGIIRTMQPAQQTRIVLGALTATAITL